MAPLIDPEHATSLTHVRNSLLLSSQCGDCVARATEQTALARTLQTAARAYGEAAFAFEEVERIEDETLSPELRDLVLKKRLSHWRDALQAQAIELSRRTGP